MSFQEWSLLVGVALSVVLALVPWMFKVHAKLAVIASKGAASAAPSGIVVAFGLEINETKGIEVDIFAVAVLVEVMIYPIMR